MQARLCKSRLRSSALRPLHKHQRLRMEGLGPGVVVADLWALVKTNYGHHTPLPHAFSLKQPYQSADVAGADDEQHGGEGAEKQERRRRKNKASRVPTSRDQDANRRHAATAPPLAVAAEQLAEWLASGGAGSIRQALGISMPVATAEPPGIELGLDTAGPAADDIPPDWVAMGSLLRVLRPQVAWAEADAAGPSPADPPCHLFNRLIHNPGSRERLAVAGGHDVLVPAGSSFLLSDFKQLGPLLAQAGAACGAGHAGQARMGVA